MSTTTTPDTTNPVCILVDRGAPFNFDGPQFEDTNGEPIAMWNRDCWDLFVLGEDLPLMLGGHREMTDDEVRELAREVLARG